MDIKFQLKGDWDFEMTSFFMKAMFCREIQFSYISPESISFLKDWARLGAPFALTDFNKIFDDYFTEFSESPSRFLRSFFNEFKRLCWPEEEYGLFLSALFEIENPPLKCSSQIVYLKLVKHISVNRGIYIPEYAPIDRMPNLSFDINYWILNELYEPIDDLFDILNEQRYFNIHDNFRKETHEELLILIDPSLSSRINSISVKFESIRTFQELLDLLFKAFLTKEVPSYSYGNKWTITKYTGSDYVNVNKLGNRDNRTLSEVGIMKNDILKLMRK
jgi:hypothetical protein